MGEGKKRRRERRAPLEQATPMVRLGSNRRVGTEERGVPRNRRRKEAILIKVEPQASLCAVIATGEKEKEKEEGKLKKTTAGGEKPRMASDVKPNENVIISVIPRKDGGRVRISAPLNRVRDFRGAL